MISVHRDRATDIYALTIDQRVERRKHPRFALRVPLCLYWGNGSDAVNTTTEDLSAGGLSCRSPVPVPVDARIAALVPFPSHQPASEPVWLYCRVRVARVVYLGDAYYLGCEIEDYTVLTGTAEASRTTN